MINKVVTIQKLENIEKIVPQPKNTSSKFLRSSALIYVIHMKLGQLTTRFSTFSIVRLQTNDSLMTLKSHVHSFQPLIVCLTGLIISFSGARKYRKFLAYQNIFLQSHWLNVILSLSFAISRSLADGNLLWQRCHFQPLNHDSTVE